MLRISLELPAWSKKPKVTLRAGFGSRGQFDRCPLGKLHGAQLTPEGLLATIPAPIRALFTVG